MISQLDRKMGLSKDKIKKKIKMSAPISGILDTRRARVGQSIFFGSGLHRRMSRDGFEGAVERGRTEANDERRRGLPEGQPRASQACLRYLEYPAFAEIHNRRGSERRGETFALPLVLGVDAYLKFLIVCTHF